MKQPKTRAKRLAVMILGRWLSMHPHPSMGGSVAPQYAGRAKQFIEHPLAPRHLIESPYFKANRVKAIITFFGDPAHFNGLSPLRNAKAALRKEKKTSRHGNFITPTGNSFFDSDEWKAIRYRALRHYGRKCMCCGAENSDGKKMHVDHIKPRSKYPELALTFSNLQVLCEDCNIGKGATDETDFRPSALVGVLNEAKA